MYIVGQEEIDALAEVLRKGALFRYGVGDACARFEKRYAAHLGVCHFALAGSGTFGLTAAMIGLGLGPGDEVLVPAHTYMATATAVLAVGAIPVIVDVDESLTLDPAAVEDAIGPATRAVVPVHMWGAACDMDTLLAIARRRDLLVIEDACQGIGGAHRGRMFGSMGHAAGFSFNYYKNITAGEGGGVATNDDRVIERARCAIDPCHYYWQGRGDGPQPFAGCGVRASELMGAMLDVQLDRLPGMIARMRAERRRILEGTAGLGNLGLVPAPMHSPDEDCATQLMYQLPTAEAAARFAARFPAVIAGSTGRHNYTEWDQVLMGEGAHHPAMNPYNHPDNQRCRRTYRKDMCRRSLDILARTVMVPMHPLHDPTMIDAMVHNIDQAARIALAGLPESEADFRPLAPLDTRKFDIKTEAVA